MADKLSYISSAWFRRWREWMYRKRDGSKDNSDRINCIEFALINLLISYLLTILVCFTFFLIKFNWSLKETVSKIPGKYFGEICSMFLGYALGCLTAIFLAAIISYVVYKILGSTCSFAKHNGIVFELTFLEPIAASFFTYLFLNEQSSDSIILLIWGIVFVTRIWYVFVGFKVMKSIHSISISKVRIGYIIGFVPAFLLFNILVYFYSWIAISFIVDAWRFNQ